MIVVCVEEGPTAATSIEVGKHPARARQLEHESSERPSHGVSSHGVSSHGICLVFASCERTRSTELDTTRVDVERPAQQLQRVLRPQHLSM